MPKPKLLLKSDKKKGKQAKAQPSTADEYLEAGVDFEEAGEKWRGGDAVKSTRFFVRAINCYEEALAKFPASFDLAYNKARIQYELTQYPKLLAQLPGTLLELLETALGSSRYALNLKQDNAEVLYTTAQILSSLAEAASSQPQSQYQPLALLEESLELFQRCLTLQEMLFTDSQTQAEMDSSDPNLEDGELSITSEAPESAVEEERWASIVEPITTETLLDTVVAQLEVLTLVCGVITDTDSKVLSFIEEYSSPLLQLKLPHYQNGVSSEAGLTAAIAAASFLSALADANSQHGRINASTYFQTLQEAWSIDISQSAEGLVSAAESLITYNSTVRNDPAESASRWKALSSAQDLLTKASKLPDVDKLGKIYLLRGDVDLLRFQLEIDIARKSRPVLAKNAEKFYRGAKGSGEGIEGALKEAIAKALGGDVQSLREAVKEAGEEVARAVLVECWEDGITTREELEGWGL